MLGTTGNKRVVANEMSESGKRHGFDVPKDSHDTVPVETRDDEGTFV